jgi:Flp pilus assembly protein TadD
MLVLRVEGRVGVREGGLWAVVAAVSTARHGNRIVAASPWRTNHQDAETKEEGVAEDPRIEALVKMAEAHPKDSRPRFGLAMEYEKAERWEDAVHALREYLALADDEGNAYGRLGKALRALGREEEAKAAYRDGIEAATRHSHPTMVAEFEEVLEEWDHA